MIFGLPWTSWLLLILAVGFGLCLSLSFYLIHRGDLTASTPGDPARAEPDSPA